MSSRAPARAADLSRPEALRRARLLNRVTIGWNVVEADTVRQGLIEQPRSIALLRIKAGLCGHAGLVEEGR